MLVAKAGEGEGNNATTNQMSPACAPPALLRVARGMAHRRRHPPRKQGLCVGKGREGWKEGRIKSKTDKEGATKTDCKFPPQRRRWCKAEGQEGQEGHAITKEGQEGQGTACCTACWEVQNRGGGWERGGEGERGCDKGRCGIWGAELAPGPTT